MTLPSLSYTGQVLRNCNINFSHYSLEPIASFFENRLLINELQSVICGSLLHIHYGELTSIKEQLSKQDERLNNLEQYSRRNCLLIHGVAEVGAGSESEDDCVASAVSIFKEKLKVDILPFHIDRAHRIGKKDSAKNRAIIVKFVSYAQRRLVFSVKKLLKGSGIHITESLTKMNYQILDEAKKIYYKENVWTYDGRVIVKDRLDRKHTVVSMEDLKSLTVKTLANSAAFTPTAPSTSSRSNSSQIPKPKPVNNVPPKRGKAKK
ncbi:hypothetical protein M8J75_005825 [Diaphorina citri]|nr:hypothetical protein M8J75_005825 [Diaphorina citri]